MNSTAAGRGQRKRTGKLKDKITKITKSEEQKGKKKRKRREAQRSVKM